VLIPLASLGGWAGWYFTRSWEPLNIPISLARGHRQAERFSCPDTTLSCDTTSLAEAVVDNVRLNFYGLHLVIYEAEVL
jgi:hypothetical protein